jgi:hypothetical protein
MRRALSLVLAVGCGSSTAAPADPIDSGSLTNDTALDVEVTDTPMMETPSSLRRCVKVTGDECFLLTPVESGLPAGGTNANVDQYALRPTSGARGKLMIFFNGSGGTPAAGTRGSLTANLYATARAAGLHVFAVSYRSDDSVGMLCKGDDACFLPTRRTIVTGTFEMGAASSLSTIAPHEGALVRVYAALQTLAMRDPAGGWGAFLDPTATKPVDKIKWPLVIASGHSQGGGHAALLGKAFAIDRVVALSSPCDSTATGPASWLDASKSMFSTSPATKFHGLGAPGDVICSGYPEIWTVLGLDASRKHADATVCTGSTPHSASLECVENAPTWKRMLE